jgi:hypothetical protein
MLSYVVLGYDGINQGLVHLPLEISLEMGQMHKKQKLDLGKNLWMITRTGKTFSAPGLQLPHYTYTVGTNY